MLKHSDIWHAVDRLAARYSMSPSGLARRAGLDPTTFNKSKRITREGKQRWPNTESIAKILEATGASIA
jgi:phage repressor protein C with HTH and peptisase S24 domain